jgi:hypothetical protein
MKMLNLGPSSLFFYEYFTVLDVQNNLQLFGDCPVTSLFIANKKSCYYQHWTHLSGFLCCDKGMRGLKM